MLHHGQPGSAPLHLPHPLRKVGVEQDEAEHKPRQRGEVEQEVEQVKEKIGPVPPCLVVSLQGERLK
jgi:hypothetical protein